MPRTMLPYLRQESLTSMSKAYFPQAEPETKPESEEKIKLGGKQTNKLQFYFFYLKNILWLITYINIGWLIVFTFYMYVLNFKPLRMFLLRGFKRAESQWERPLRVLCHFLLEFLQGIIEALFEHLPCWETHYDSS